MFCVIYCSTVALLLTIKEKLLVKRLKHENSESNNGPKLRPLAERLATKVEVASAASNDFVPWNMSDDKGGQIFVSKTARK